MLEGGSGDNKDINQGLIVGHQFEQVTLNPSDILTPQADVVNSAISTGNDMSMGKDSSGGIVVARGTGDGLILRLDGRAERHLLLSTLLDYVESRKSFFSGQEVTLEWIEARPEDGVVAELSDALAARFQLLVKASRMFERGSKNASTRKDTPNLSGAIQVDDISKTAVSAHDSYAAPKMRPTPVSPKMGERVNPPLAPHGIGSHISGSPAFSPASSYAHGGSSLFDGVAALNSNSGTSATSPSQERNSSTSEALLWDEADTRIIRDTLRGGQKIESEHSVVIQGDVNSGAEIVAGGDIFVLGRLRGVAHAGAYDESGGGRRIFALQMQPTQLRIGSVISQGSEEGGRMPEMAKIEGNMIVVEPYGAGSSVRRLSK